VSKRRTTKDLNEIVSFLDRQDILLPGTPWKLVDYVFVEDMYKFTVEIAPGQYIEVKKHPHETLNAVVLAVQRQLVNTSTPALANPASRPLPPLWTIEIWRRGYTRPTLLRVKRAYGHKPHDVMPAVQQYLRKKGWRMEKVRFFHEHLLIHVMLYPE
jgi:hypothetical protein